MKREAKRKGLEYDWKPRTQKTGKSSPPRKIASPVILSKKDISGINRARAIESGSIKYISLTKCPNGHIGERYTSKGTCVQCSANESKSTSKKIYDKEYYKNNKERISSRSRKYHLKHKERILSRVKEWSKNNKDKVRTIKQNYKHKRRVKESTGVKTSDLVEWKNKESKVCYWCGVSCESDYHVDHYEPLSKGGSHDIDNLVISCPKCNLSKSSKDPYLFAQEVGKLF